MRGSFTDSVRNVATSTRTASATRSARRVLRRRALGASPSRCSHATRARDSRSRDCKFTSTAQSPRHLLLFVAFEHVAHLDVVEVFDANSALESVAHFLDVVLEAAQRRDGSVVDLHPVAEHANLGFAEHDLLLLGAKHALERGTNVFDRFVDDLVELDVHAFTLGRGAP